MKVTIETTADGSPTFYREDLDEHYHSVKGAIAESRHVYVSSGWEMAGRGSARVRVFEVGFGSGLNAALTAEAALDAKIATDYHSVELNPLDAPFTELYSNALPEELRDMFRAVNSAPWQSSSQVNAYFSLTKIEANLLTMELPDQLNVVYYDAFAPEKQPEMWDEAIFCKLYEAMAPGGMLTTYCAKGAIRRMLERIGFSCERLPGPPGGKREILRATRPN